MVVRLASTILHYLNFHTILNVFDRTLSMRSSSHLQRTQFCLAVRDEQPHFCIYLCLYGEARLLYLRSQVSGGGALAAELQQRAAVRRQAASQQRRRTATARLAVRARTRCLKYRSPQRRPHLE